MDAAALQWEGTTGQFPPALPTQFAPTMSPESPPHARRLSAFLATGTVLFHVARIFLAPVAASKEVV